MTKFKVGDRVISTYSTRGNLHQHGIIRYSSGDGWNVRFDDVTTDNKKVTSLKLESEMTMDDLKVGDVVEQLFSGVWRPVKILARVDNLVAISGVGDDAVFNNWAAIESLKKGSYFRLPTETKEMTVAEVEKLVGHKVKIVKG